MSISGARIADVLPQPVPTVVRTLSTILAYPQPEGLLLGKHRGAPAFPAAPLSPSPRLHRLTAELQALDHRELVSVRASPCRHWSQPPLGDGSSCGDLHGFFLQLQRQEARFSSPCPLERDCRTSRLNTTKPLVNSSCQCFLCCNNKCPISGCHLGLAVEPLQAHRGGWAAVGVGSFLFIRKANLFLLLSGGRAGLPRLPLVDLSALNGSCALSETSVPSLIAFFLRNPVAC